MHSFFYHAAGEITVDVDGGLGDVVRAGGGSSFSGHAFEDHRVISTPQIITTDLPNDEFGVNPIENFQELLTTGVEVSSTPFLPRPTTTTKPPPRAVPPLSSTNSRVLGIGKRSRKGQAKKVVCVPAPAADQESNNKANVVVPSDLWAWRKYGQKPIKGSPYPRGYYKCSSSKGCLARKQVERSPSDPTMLVITYTAEHNHPWPTQRNSLAGSSRSSPHPKNHGANTDDTAPALKDSTPDEEAALTRSSPPLEAVKEENWDETFEQIFSSSYLQPLQTQLESENLDFFAELGGLDPDPVSLILSSRDAIGDRLQLEGETKALDPLSLFDWDGN
ncbi:putative WRKY transcription factor 35 [Iris pallida]|uniref:WRKY transcription factor 35 n=1 Tax=Iris pallida TaxID=29817 RepID=A0AAX6F148_IRIPA|nr:putative WRKY transcription factor 35 [Iris pallida]